MSGAAIDIIRWCVVAILVIVFGGWLLKQGSAFWRVFGSHISPTHFPPKKDNLGSAEKSEAGLDE